MDQDKVLLFICIALLLGITTSHICSDSESTPSCTVSVACICQSAVCISKNHPCPDKENLTFIQPEFERIPQYAFENYMLLRQLEITGGNVQSLHSNAFVGLTNLETLILRDNSILSIDNDTFTELTSLRELDLSGNILDSIDEGIFSNNRGLKTLNLERNILNTITRRTFEGCYRLQSLRLNTNSISYIEDEAFSGLNDLQELYLNDNYIYLITSKYFLGLTSLRYLNLHGNSIQVVLMNSLTEMVNLQNLDLSLNQISFIANDTFGSLPSLKTLVLSDNKIKWIDSEAFRKLNSLETLILSSNHLTIWSLVDFRMPSNLKELVLSQNNISEISLPTRSSTPSFPKLQYLDLSKNLLTTFASFFLKDAPLLGHPDIADQTSPTAFYLQENPLTCNCDYTVLQEGVEQIQSQCIQNSTVECYNNTYVNQLQHQDSGVYCEVFGSPLPEVIWKDSNNEVVKGYYNISGKITWLPEKFIDKNFVCMIYNEESEDNNKEEVKTKDEDNTNGSLMCGSTLTKTFIPIAVYIMMN